MDQLIELGCIDLAALEPSKALAHVLAPISSRAARRRARSPVTVSRSGPTLKPTDASAAGRVAKDRHQAAQALDPPTDTAGPTTVSIDRKHSLRRCPFSRARTSSGLRSSERGSR